jgi:hypothetical protein
MTTITPHSVQSAEEARSKYGGGGIKQTRRMRLERYFFYVAVVVCMLLFAGLEYFIRYLWRRSYPESDFPSFYSNPESLSHKDSIKLATEEN